MSENRRKVELEWFHYERACGGYESEVSLVFMEYNVFLEARQYVEEIFFDALYEGDTVDFIESWGLADVDTKERYRYWEIKVEQSFKTFKQMSDYEMNLVVKLLHKLIEENYSIEVESPKDQKDFEATIRKMLEGRD